MDKSKNQSEDDQAPIVWRVKPGVDTSMLADRFATIAAEAAASQADEGRTLQAAAAKLADDAFLDPRIARRIASGAITLPRALATINAQLSAPSPTMSIEWPTTIAGGERVLHFRLVGHLGHGGMGSVFLAWDERLDRRVVLKRLASSQDHTDGYRRLERDARTAARLRHPNIVTIYALEYVGNEPIVVQEYVEGDDLDARVGAIPLVRGLRYALAIASGMAHAHDVGVVHRDLKPRNIRVRPDDTPVILDFGLGKAINLFDGASTQRSLTQTGVVMGTPHYMAPEQWAGDEVTTAVDVFAFGVLLYEIFTGEIPFQGSSNTSLFHATLSGDIDVVGVPPIAQELVKSCLAPRAADRPTMRTVVATIERALADESSPTNAPTPVPDVPGAVLAAARPTPWVGRRREDAMTALQSPQAFIQVHVTLGTTKVVSVNELANVAANVLGDVSSQWSLGSEEVRAIRDSEYFAARANGDVFYCAKLTRRASGAVPIEPVLAAVASTLSCASRLAEALGVPDKLALLVGGEVCAAGHWFIASAEWSERFSATVEAMAPKRSELHSAVQTTLEKVRGNPTEIVQTLTEALIAGSRILTIPGAVYRRIVEPAFGRT